MKIHVSREPSGSMNCAVRKSQKSMRLFPAMVKSFTAPQESEQKTAISEHVVVTIIAAPLRLVCSCSRKKAVPISCMEIVDVSAARTNRA